MMTLLPDLSAEITALFIGKVEDRWPGKPPSAIRKRQTDAVLHLQSTGFTEDSQADLEVHGGLEKAVHHYAADHLEFWRQEFPDHAEKFVPGCFGENISTVGLNEQNLCLGDVLTMGTATVQICQGRQPCWKLNAHMENEAMAAAFQRTGKTGWYYRVLENGEVKAGDQIKLIERSCPDWSVERVTKARFNPRLDQQEAEAIASLPAISEAWQESFRKKQNAEYKENTSARLQGKSSA